MAYDAVVIGSGPNGLAAAITLARAGRSVLVLEAAATIGGGARSAELTLPGFVHDVCSAIHPLGVASPFFKELPLHEFGLEWIQPDVAAAHPLPDGTAAAVFQNLDQTCASLGLDGAAYRKWMRPLVGGADVLLRELLGPVGLPRHPILMGRFGLRAIRSARGLARSLFRGEQARGMFAGMAAHSVLPLDHWLTAAVGMMLCITAHSVGWPLPRGGSQQIALAMGRYLKSLGGEIQTGLTVRSFDDLPSAKAVLFDTSPAAMSEIAGERFPERYRRTLRGFRYGPGVFKVDWALSGPIPWTAEACRRAGTVHVGGTLDDVAAAEAAAWSNQPSERPFLLVAQQSLFDSTRAPAGQHTGWAYCHVPHGSTFDMTERIERQMERFAPGFRERILKRHTMNSADYAAYNPNNIGGDITGGVMDFRQIVARPALRWNPYRTAADNLFLCSASTPPGGGVHGMCGYHAARAALRSVLKHS